MLHDCIAHVRGPKNNMAQLSNRDTIEVFGRDEQTSRAKTIMGESERRDVAAASPL